jgi:hypothetical protein
MTNATDLVFSHVAKNLPADGEKFTDEDVTSTLFEAGLEYLKGYNGQFAYLLDLKTRNPNKLSIGQVRGILNCIKAEITRKANVKADGGFIGVAVADGRYALDIDGKFRFFRVNTPTKGKWEGFTFLKEVFGGGELGKPREDAIRNQDIRNPILKAISEDSQALARYGQELGICGNCGLQLTDEESRAIGIGPVCRKNLGM